MGTELAKVIYKCDWKDEFGDVCAETGEFSGGGHETAAHEAGWGWYANAHIRTERWTTGCRYWFCPVHSTVFRNNHGWGGLEDYGPPKRWWENIFRSKP